jgi:hypothetical protein
MIHWDCHMDMRISDVIVTLDKRWEDDLAGAVACLKKAGLEIRDAYDHNSIVEGTIDRGKVHDLEKLECVDYVRTIFTYDADFPAGDPRDQNGR